MINPQGLEALHLITDLFFIMFLSFFDFCLFNDIY